MAISKTAAGTYAVDFRDQDRRRILRTFDTFREANDFYKEVLAQVARREYVKPVKRTVKEMAEEWYQKKAGQGTYERNSLIGWKTHLDKYIIPSLGALLVQDLDVERIEGAAGMWNEKISAKTCNKVLTTLAA